MRAIFVFFCLLGITMFSCSASMVSRPLSERETQVLDEAIQTFATAHASDKELTACIPSVFRLSFVLTSSCVLWLFVWPLSLAGLLLYSFRQKT